MQEKTKGRGMRQGVLNEEQFYTALNEFKDKTYQQVAKEENFLLSQSQIGLLENIVDRLKEVIKSGEAVIDPQHMNQPMYRALLERYGTVTKENITDYIMNLTREDIYGFDGNYFKTFKDYLLDSNMSEEEIDLIPS